MCYFKSPFDIVYERGDSVALAVLSGTIHFPETSPFTQVNIFLYFQYRSYKYIFFQDMHDCIVFMLQISPQDRPFINNVINKLQMYVNKMDNVA